MTSNIQVWIYVALVAGSFVCGSILGYRLGREAGEIDTARWYEERRRRVAK